MIHPHDEEAFQSIDASVFSGDAIEYDDFRKRLAYFMGRWRKQLDETSERFVGLDVICQELSQAGRDAISGDVDALVELYNKRFPDSPIRYIGDDCFWRR